MKGKSKKPSVRQQLDFSPKEQRPTGPLAIAPTDLDDWSAVEKSSSTTGGFWSQVSGFFSGWTSHTLSERDLTVIIAKMRERLIDRNVAASVADELCATVQQQLIGKTISNFSSAEPLVRAAFTDALTAVLACARDINVLYDIRRKKDSGAPYVIVFCGVNGVGKSTNLAKIAAYLTQQKLRVSLAACDTFRSGAIEQLRVHATALDIPLFSRGYEKEPATVARAAIEEASRAGTDVVLIDTAGRMQHNAPLMAALVSLVCVNQPDLILFVGEALVGNDGIDQLTTFKKAIEDGTKGLRTVDGIVLSKFDTVDDKMGAALSMVRITGKPVIFVGTGQTYGDLKKLSVDVVVRTLLS